MKKLVLRAVIYTLPFVIRYGLFDQFKADVTDIFLGFSQSITLDIYNYLAKLVPSPESDLIMGVVFGTTFDKSSKYFYDLYKQAGVTHVVVVSGYNLQIIRSYINKIKINEYSFFGMIAIVILLFLYSAICGMGAPVLRAFLMVTIILFCKIFGYKCSVYQALFTSTYLMLLINFEYLTSLSFQLSFAATYGLIMLGNYTSEYVHSSGNVSESLSTFLYTWPIISYSFGSINFVSLVTNFMVLWMVPYLTVAGFVIILGKVLDSVITRTIMSYLLFPYAKVFDVVSQNMSHFPLFEFRIGILSLIFYYLFLNLMIKRLARGNETLP